jgi:hypothetical protein
MSRSVCPCIIASFDLPLSLPLVPADEPLVLAGLQGGTTTRIILHFQEEGKGPTWSVGHDPEGALFFLLHFCSSCAVPPGLLSTAGR